MRIVAQNRGFSVEMDMVILDVCDEIITCTVPGLPARFLGKYRDPKRALEVFGDIHKKYSPTEVMFYNIDPDVDMARELRIDDYRCLHTNMGNSSVEFFESKIYYMPEE